MSNPFDLELVLLAQRLGITLDEDDLAVLGPVYVRLREGLDRLHDVLPPEEEPASIIAAPFLGSRQ